jgi:hypothetical protein
VLGGVLLEQDVIDTSIWARAAGTLHVFFDNYTRKVANELEVLKYVLEVHSNIMSPNVIAMRDSTTVNIIKPFSDVSVAKRDDELIEATDGVSS